MNSRNGLAIRFALGFTATIAIGCLGLCGSGCSFNQPYPAKDTFVLRGGEIGRSPATLSQTVRVEPVRIAPPYDGRSLVYRTGDVSVRRDYYNVFIAPPDEMATAELIRMLTESGVFKQVSGVASASGADVILESMVTDLYADERDSQKPVAVCRAKFRRLKNEAGGTVVVSDQTFEATVPIASNSGAGIAAALGQAFGTTVKKFVESVAPPAK
jgi:ABC-type uncharacterized transport system auxiliary subunit